MKTKPNQTEYIASHTIFLVQYIGTVYRVHCVLTTFNAMQCNAIAIASAFESVYPNNKPSQANSIAYVALQLEFLLLLTMALEFHSFSQKCFARLSKSFEYEKLTLFFPSVSLSLPPSHFICITNHASRSLFHSKRNYFSHKRNQIMQMENATRIAFEWRYVRVARFEIHKQRCRTLIRAPSIAPSIALSIRRSFDFFLCKK